MQGRPGGSGGTQNRPDHICRGVLSSHKAHVRMLRHLDRSEHPRHLDARGSLFWRGLRCCFVVVVVVAAAAAAQVPMDNLCAAAAAAAAQVPMDNLCAQVPMDNPCALRGGRHRTGGGTRSRTAC